jgi:hypothetical protein
MDDVIGQARRAVAAGAPKDAVAKRLSDQFGLDPSILDE